MERVRIPTRSRCATPSQNTTAPRAGRLQVYSQSLAAAGPLLLFGDGRAPGPVDPDHVVRDLEVRTYYVANSSVDRPGWPALRVKALTESRGAAQFRDEELLPGVEDLQVEIGVAMFAADGAWRVHFVAPDSPRVREGMVVAVRLWLRIRCRRHRTGIQRRSHADVCQRDLHAIIRRGEATAHGHRAHRRAAQRAVAVRSPQRGATLVVGLMLLALVTLLGLAGAATAHIEAQLAHNEQFRENAASAASAGVEYAINLIVTTAAPEAVPSSASATLPGSADRFEIQTRFLGYDIALPQAAGAGLAGAHFESPAPATRRVAPSITSAQSSCASLPRRASVAASECEPTLAGVRCHEPGELVRLSWQRIDPLAP